jgi:polysaccharide chain length determinant protein (PEP-CTERM system associated)
MTQNKLVLLDPFSGASNQVLSPEERLQQAQLELALLTSKYSEKHPLVLAKKRESLLLEGQVQASGRLVQMRDRLRELEQDLASLKSRYSEKHPAVKHKKSEIDGLRNQLTSLEAAFKQPSMTENGGASNPAYVALKSDLDKMEISIASLQEEKSRLKRQSEALYSKLHDMPQVAKEYNELEADHQVAKTQYLEIQQKLLTAQVSQGMEEEQLGESFRIVEPAFLPETPHKPNRLAILLIGAILGMGVSIGLASVMEYIDDKVHDVKTLEKHTGFPVFSVIPRIVTPEEKSHAKRRKVVLAAAALSLGVVGVLAFHYLVMDLYVFYAKVLRLLDTKPFI